MAPEFFPFIFCVILALGCLVVAGAAIFVDLSRRVLQAVFPLVLRFLRPLFVLALVPMLGMLLVAGQYVYQQYFLNEPMASAAHQGDIDRVRALLNRGASADSWGVDFVSPAIVTAAGTGRKDIVQLLIERGADTNVRDSHCKSALQQAREGGHVDVVELLLKAGARE